MKTYAQGAPETTKVVPLAPALRGPRPKIADTDLPAATRADLDASPLVGECHHKVWTRLRILAGSRLITARLAD